MLEQVIERKFRKAVIALGGECVKLSGGSRGMPDRMVLLPGAKAIFIEFKRPTGVVSMHQARWLARLQDLGFTASIATSVEEALGLLDNAKPTQLAVASKS